MIQLVPNSIVLNYIILIATQIKWACDYLLQHSCFPHQLGFGLNNYHNHSIASHFKKTTDFEESTECVVCLCRIDEEDEIQELRCHHLFHEVCLNRWLGYGHVTCPLCRNHVTPPRLMAELQQELVVIDFCAARSSDDRSMWWLR
ncbi:hypothetical protein ACJIZ3_020072 [Penstemon smallii]|uniref:RING-type domain-containing protein n=1 Tax=Penstemon smallii TaxID=265156 RepID=A0ABD3SI65_9LAMI